MASIRLKIKRSCYAMLCQQGARGAEIGKLGPIVSIRLKVFVGRRVQKLGHQELWEGVIQQMRKMGFNQNF